MPILQVEVVTRDEAELRGLAQQLAAVAGAALESRPGGTWVRLRALPVDQYGENGPILDELPVFVSLLLGDPPEGEARAAQAETLAGAIGALLGRPAERVHILYEPAARGRIAFGGKLLT